MAATTEFDAIPVAEFDAVPVAEFDAIPVAEFDAVPVAEFDAIPVQDDAVVAQEAKRASMGALQALDVMRAPLQLDWSDVAERSNYERFYNAESLRAQALMADEQGGDGSRFRDAAAKIVQNINPDSKVGRMIWGDRAAPDTAMAQRGIAALQGIQPSTMEATAQEEGAAIINQAAGPALANTLQPVGAAISAAERNAGSATGGALGAASMLYPPAATAGLLARLFSGVAPLVGGFVGSQVGGSAQEGAMRAVETPEQTEARQQAVAQQTAANPVATRIGEAAANLPFFKFSTQEIFNAFRGNTDAQRNVMAAMGIGAGTNVLGSLATGQSPTLGGAVTSGLENAFMSSPTRLGRALGFVDSTVAEPALSPRVEETATPAPVTPEVDTNVLSVRGPVEVPPAATPAPAEVSAPAAETPASPVPKLTPHAPQAEGVPVVVSTAVKVPDGFVTGENWNSSHALLLPDALDRNLDISDWDNSLGFIVQDPDGTQRFADRQEAYQIAEGVGQVSEASPNKRLTSEILTEAKISPQTQPETAPVPSSSGEPVAPGGEAAPDDAARIEQLVAAGMSPEDAAAGLAKIKATEAPPAPPADVPPIAETPLPQDPNAPTSNKEAVVNAERAARDLDPVIKEARISNPEAMDRAETIVAQNPLKPQEIIARLSSEGPHERTIAFEDSAILLNERSKLNAERKVALDRANDETLSAEQRAAAKGQFDTVEGQINALDQAAQGARSTWGRFGQLWKQSKALDFSEDSLLSRARMKKGEALTPEESASVKAVADEVAAAQKDADVAVEKAEAAAVEKQVDSTIGEIAKQPDVDPTVRSLADRIIAKLDKQAEQARKNIRAHFSQLNALGPLDPRILTNFTVLAANRIAKNAIKASQWVAEMVQEFGEMARPYAEQAFGSASAKLDEMVNAGTSDKKKRVAAKEKILGAGEQQERVTAALAARVQEGESLDSLGNYIDRLVESFVRGGVRDRASLVSAVKGVLEPLSPGITDRKVAELISGYGKATLLSKDPLKVIKRDLKGQLQQVSKLEALAAKEPLRKTGPERRTQSDEERRLVKEVNEAKKAAGVVTTDPATQLKSTMDAARTRFANEIKDLTFEIETGTRPPARTPIEYAQDIEIMRGLRDRLRQVARSLDEPKNMTDEQRIAITTRGLNDSIAALESRIAGQQPKARRAAPDTPEIRALKAKRDALREEVREIEAADSLLQENRKAEALVRSIEQAEATLAGATKAGKQQGPESQLVAEAREQLAAVRAQIQAKRDADPVVQQERMDAAEAAVEKSIRKLDEQIQAGDLSVQRAPSKAGSQRLEDLRLQRDALNRLRNQLRAEARPKPNPLDVAIKARKSALKRQEADYEARIARGDFGPRTRKPPLDISGDKDAMDALARVKAAKEKFLDLQEKWELENRTATQKVADGVSKAWDATRNLMLTLDLSAPLQTAFSMAARPIEGARAMLVGGRAFAEQLFKNSDTYAKRVQQQIENSPNNKNGLYKQMKLELSLGDKREENAGSVLERLADLDSRWQDIPDFVKGLIGMNGKQLVSGAKGIAKALPKVVGLGIKASNTGFNAIANHMRARTADAMLKRWFSRRGAPTKQQLELLGNQINMATGKGGLKGETALGKLLFAPNYYLSILKQLTLQPARKAALLHEGGAAREVLEEYVRAAITATSVLTLQYLFGNRDKQTLDPRSPNFARAMTDNGTSLDFTMGRGAWASLAAQIFTGQKINKKGYVEKQDRGQAFLTFLKGRLSREISTALTTAFGEDFRGKPIDKAKIAQEMITPLAWRDVDKVLKREGMTRGSFIQMLNLLGVTHRMAD